MKRHYILAALLAVAFGAAAQEKMDLGSRARMRRAESGVAVAAGAIRKAAHQSPATVRAFVTLADNADAGELHSAEGITVASTRGRPALVEGTPEAIRSLGGNRSVRRISIERELSPKMDRARKASRIDDIHNGTSLPIPYTGAGVVAGLVDGGFDPNHLNFKNADGTSRISHFTYYRPTQSGTLVEEKYGADYIPNIDTEDDQTYHGTHTLGIMAGSYRGPVKAAVKQNAFAGTVEEMANPYYGVAYGADIAVSCGATTDYYVALGVESILDYAYEKKSPAVINLSLGSNTGGHDGTSTICRYLDVVSELDRVVICVAAGNEGDLPIALNKRFTSDDHTVGSFLYPAVNVQGYQNLRLGQTYVYSDSPDAFEIQAVIVNTSRNAVAMRMPLEAGANTVKYWVSSSEYQAEDTDVVSPQLARYLTGYVGLGCETDPESGRYYAVLDCMAWDNTSGSNAKGNYVLGFIVTGKDGQRVDIFNDGIYNNLSSYGMDGYSDGTSDGSISDVATGHNCVVVGSYNTRDDWASLDGNVYGYRGSFPDGGISSFSSWATLYDGRRLPTVCAPGASVISSSNEYYINEWGIEDNSLQAYVTADGRRYSWHQSIGTSMATPVVTGSIALWLEANPELTYKDVLAIIAETSVKDNDVVTTGNPVQWGAGKFDAYAGLRKAIEMAGVSDVTASDSRPMVLPLGAGRWSATLAEASSVSLDVHDISGRLVASAKSSGPTVETDLSGIAAGVYLFSVNGGKSVKIHVK